MTTKEFARKIRQVRSAVESGNAKCQALTDDGVCNCKAVGYNARRGAVAPLCNDHLLIVEQEDARNESEQYGIRVFPLSAEEREIEENHRADVENGLTEAEASESDAFERRALGIPDSHEECCHPDYCALRD